MGAASKMGAKQGQVGSRSMLTPTARDNDEWGPPLPSHDHADL